MHNLYLVERVIFSMALRFSTEKILFRQYLYKTEWYIGVVHWLLCWIAHVALPISGYKIQPAGLCINKHKIRK